MRVSLAVHAAVFCATAAAAQRSPAAGAASATISDLRYEVSFDRSRSVRRSIGVVTRFTSAGRGDILLSLPAWTPGAYELSWFARNVSAFTVTGDGKPLGWDKLDFDTWRVRSNGARAIEVSFDYQADSLDNAMAWASDDFVLFNGTNLFLYPEGSNLAFAGSVEIRTEPDWKVATGMTSAGGARARREGNYHDLVDMPFFVGAIDLDSAMVAGRWMRLATYPSGQLAGTARAEFWDQLKRMTPPMVAVFGETPYADYTNLIMFDSSSTGGSALEHANSHVGIYTPMIIGHHLLPSITAHEIFHAWNVKRMRPAEMVPYRYDRAQPTQWLWVSEGITDYYADLALVRGGIVDSTQFLELTNAKIEEVAALPPVALEDASLSTWIHPQDGTGYIYYPKGSLAGLLLDIMIRDASDNAASLDLVLRDVYHRTYKSGTAGFSGADWWGAVTRAAKGRSFADFSARYIDGREPFPYETVLPLAGLRFRVDSIREPRIGVFTESDSSGVRVVEIDSGSSAALAGVRPGDYLLAVGAIPVTEGFGDRYRARYGRSDGESIPIRVRRDGTELSLPMRVTFSVRTERHLVFDRAASPKALRIRRGVLTGNSDR
jgi:predicted metalloprotease with PDZ domain